MAEKGRRDKGKATEDKGKGKLFPNWAVRKPRSGLKPTNLASPSVIEISSDSDDEGSVEEISPPRTAPPAAKKAVIDEVELPPGAKLLLDCEAAYILESINESLSKFKDKNVKIPVSFEKALLQMKGAERYISVNAVREALESLKEHGVTDWEICMIANGDPKTCEEAYKMIPSLKDKEDSIEDSLNAVLDKLADLKIKNFDP